ncbi:hypothetical protein QO001_006100 [Methylobacterium brachiatum]|uniref:Uncharacterized protein n=1 Tax=Methylobacterium brachiatum TaxID=269660 RepID=A0AAJ1TYV1_9HYPH|nr:hypothetical protein [Methylobacterium brachiatum]MCB4805871.1 hypothetical protein [Methylobacterium brachiatum]MDQ0547144.1 hypothetical protein [Methylobacterium brachiatum]
MTYEHLRNAFRERNRLPFDTAPAASHSDRDLQDPFASWKRRRRYRPHLAALDLDESTERALARFLTLARSGRPATSVQDDGEEPATRAQVARIEESIAVAAAEHAALRADIAGLATAFASLAGERTKGRKAGIVASTALHFWDQVMRAFAGEIRKRGPLTAVFRRATLTP